MIDFLTNNPAYVVLTAALLIWAGIAWYIMRVDRKLGQLEATAKSVKGRS